MAIIDEIKVPTVPPGDYVVRWRWDCEQSPQIWFVLNCPLIPHLGACLRSCAATYLPSCCSGADAATSLSLLELVCGIKCSIKVNLNFN